MKLPEVELLDKVCKAVCSNFARVEGGGGVNLGYLKKRGGAAASSVRRENWKTILKKK